MTNSAYAASRIGGTYIAHGERSVDMLQLTESQDGQITGVLNTMELSSDGNIDTHDGSITSGTIDGNQLTLHFSVLAVFGENIAGTVSGNTIQLESTTNNGTVQAWDFQRGSLKEFTTYAGQLKAEGQAIIFNSKLTNAAQELHQMALNAEAWTTNAKLHAQRIPEVENYYRSLENRMNSLISRERRTLNGVARNQISVAVIQANVAGTQADVQMNQLWDVTIINSGENLAKQFASLPPNCGTPAELQARGATQQTTEQWQNDCQQALSERAKFEPAFESIMKQRAELKSFQAAAQSHRQALVKESYRIQ